MSTKIAVLAVEAAVPRERILAAAARLHRALDEPPDDLYVWIQRDAEVKALRWFMAVGVAQDERLTIEEAASAMSAELDHLVVVVHNDQIGASLFERWTKPAPGGELECTLSIVSDASSVGAGRGEISADYAQRGYYSDEIAEIRYLYERDSALVTERQIAALTEWESAATIGLAQCYPHDARSYLSASYDAELYRVVHAGQPCVPHVAGADVDADRLWPVLDDGALLEDDDRWEHAFLPSAEGAPLEIPPPAYMHGTGEASWANRLPHLAQHVPAIEAFMADAWLPLVYEGKAQVLGRVAEAILLRLYAEGVAACGPWLALFEPAWVDAFNRAADGPPRRAMRGALAYLNLAFCTASPLPDRAWEREQRMIAALAAHSDPELAGPTLALAAAAAGVPDHARAFLDAPLPATITPGAAFGSEVAPTVAYLVAAAAQGVPQAHVTDAFTAFLVHAPYNLAVGRLREIDVLYAARIHFTRLAAGMPRSVGPALHGIVQRLAGRTPRDDYREIPWARPPARDDFPPDRRPAPAVPRSAPARPAPRPRTPPLVEPRADAAVVTTWPELVGGIAQESAAALRRYATGIAPDAMSDAALAVIGAAITAGAASAHALAEPAARAIAALGEGPAEKTASRFAGAIHLCDALGAAGCAVPDASRWLEPLAELASSIDPIAASRLAFAAVGAGRPDLALVFTGLPRSAFAPRETFRYRRDAWLAYVAAGLAGTPCTLAALLPAWDALLGAAPRMLRARSLDLVHLLGAARAVLERAGGAPRAGVLATLRSEIAAAAPLPAHTALECRLVIGDERARQSVAGQQSLVLWAHAHAIRVTRDGTLGPRMWEAQIDASVPARVHEALALARFPHVPVAPAAPDARFEISTPGGVVAAGLDTGAVGAFLGWRELLQLLGALMLQASDGEAGLGGGGVPMFVRGARRVR